MARVENDALEVEDPDKVIQQRRIKSILDARDAVLEARKNALELLAMNRVDSATACRILKETVDGYIRESEQKIRENLPVESYGLHIDSSEIDETDLQSASQLAAYVAWFAAPLGSVQAQTGDERLEVRGLQNFLNLPHPVVFEYETQTTSAVHGTQTEHQTERQPVPMEVSMQAYSILNAFWNKMDMDVKIEQAGLDVEDGFDSLAGNGASIADHTPQL